MSSRIAFRMVLLNGGSPAGNVDGSVTPVTFTYSPPLGKYVEVHNVTIIAGTNGNINSIFDFLSMAPLTNGIDLDTQSLGDRDLRVGVVKNNLDILRFSTINFEEKSIGNTSLFNGTVELSHPIILDSRLSDYYSYVVNDDLTPITVLNVVIAGSIYTI